MATVTLAFGLPDEECALRDAQEGTQMRGVLRDLAEWLRHEIKYADHAPEARCAYERLRGKLYDTMAEWSVSLDD